MTKICKTCKIKKSLEEFSVAPTCKYGRRAHCKECRAKVWTEVYHKEHPNFRLRKSIIRQSEKNRQLKVAFGMTEEEYLSKLKEQNGVCAICKKPEVVFRLGKLKALAVDHSHITNKNRGLLCQNCNTGIGHFFENSELLFAAIKYLDKWR